jgi:hypothetical protein
MPNIRPLIARLTEMPPTDREEFYWWMDGMTECGYSVPTGKELREKVNRKLKERYGRPDAVVPPDPKA